MNAHPDENTEISGIDISNHARLRAMQRFGVIERATDYIRDLLSKAEPVDVDYVQDAQAWRVGNITIVTDHDGEVVQTLFEREAGR